MAWRALNPHPKAQGLPTAHKRRLAHGQVRYTFVHDDLEIDDPALDVSARFFESPKNYGFAVRELEGGCTAWARDFDNGTMLVMNPAGDSHVLSPKVASRIVFADWAGRTLQDTGLVDAAQQRGAELVTVRLTLTASYELQGHEPEAARAALIQSLDSALDKAKRESGGAVQLLDHSFESSSLIVEDPQTSSDTNFSKLLDF
jgi:hypothetical protein